MRTNYYIKDSERRAFVAVRLTSCIKKYKAKFDEDTRKWVYKESYAYTSHGVAATNPDEEIYLGDRSVYFEPSGDAKHVTGAYFAESDHEELRAAAEAFAEQYWKWGESSAKAYPLTMAYFGYDYITKRVFPLEPEKIEEQGYVYPSKEAADSDNSYSVIEFDAPKAKKTYTITKTLIETYEVSADNMKEATALFNDGTAKKTGHRRSSKTELKK